jgi:enamine deaminase RidA (YjgF/YER057c/UK114 family)
LQLVSQEVFGRAAPKLRSVHTGGELAAEAQCPVTWVQDGNGDGRPISGLLAHATSGIELSPVRFNGRLVGTLFEDDHARYCALGGLGPPDAAATRADQAWQTFALMDSILRQVGMSFANVFRTWFYLADILDWYGEFNLVRNRYFSEHGVFEGLVPASTGIGGDNAAGAAVQAALLALQPKHSGVKVGSLPSPLQESALTYGSSFSRAIQVTRPGQRRIYVSGTASIGEQGQTVHVGDLDAQVTWTMQVVEAILRRQGMDWGDVTRAIAYFKHARAATAWGRLCQSRRLLPLPAVVVKNDICRDDLLFEFEADAVRFEP